MTQTLIGSVTVGAGGAASIGFTGIPQTGFTDLLVVGSLRSNRAAGVEVIKLQFNGSTAGYTDRHLIGFGSGAGYSETNSLGYISSYFANGNTTAANTFSSCGIYIPNYTVAANKSVSIDGAFEDNVTGAWQGIVAGGWSNSAAITSVSLTPQYGTAWMQGSTASLYGIANVTNAAKATGGDITSDGSYIYHTFKANGTFTPTTALVADVLLVAGGGSTNSVSPRAGGGGAGGLLYSAANSLSATGYPVVVGAGAAATSAAGNGLKGADSTALSLTAVGGGYGGGYESPTSGVGGTGGSGGGGGTVYLGPVQAGGSGTAGQGNAGGAGLAEPTGGWTAGGGGGGAGASGTAASGNSSAGSQQTPGNGGNGASTYSTWPPVLAVSANGYLAGGGAGGGINSSASNIYGTAGLGGGGSFSAGSTNTGGGAGSGGFAGGSGIVIIRYPK